MRSKFFIVEVNNKKVPVYKKIVKVYLELIEKQDMAIDEPIFNLVRQDIEKLAIENKLDTFEKLETYLLQQILNYSRANQNEFYIVTDGTF